MIVRHVPARLPIWPDAVRGGPNALLRSALFAGIHSSRRKTIGIRTSPDVEPEGVELASQDGIVVKFAGTQFNQYDADVFFEILHRARRANLGTDVVFTGGEFLHAIERARSKETYKDLDNSFRRLRNGTVDVQWRIMNKHYTFVGSLVGNYLREKETRLYRVTLFPEVLALLSPSSWTQIEWEERMKLKGKPLAQWLHSYYATHAHPFPLTVAYLQETTGSTTKLEKHFKPELRVAFDHLSALLGWRVEWEGNRVIVHRTATVSQQKHLARAEKRRLARASDQRLLNYR